jgi:hypothetical protein
MYALPKTLSQFLTTPSFNQHVRRDNLRSGFVSPVVTYALEELLLVGNVNEWPGLERWWKRG